MTSPVLVTGGTGRLGRSVVARLVEAVRKGALLPPPGHTEGVRTWDQFLTEELRENGAALDSASRVKGA
jgi:uncharacterized protein YbjT (DUF2867 family)